MAEARKLLPGPYSPRWLWDAFVARMYDVPTDHDLFRVSQFPTIVRTSDIQMGVDWGVPEFNPNLDLGAHPTAVWLIGGELSSYASVFAPASPRRVVYLVNVRVDTDDIHRNDAIVHVLNCASELHSPRTHGLEWELGSVHIYRRATPRWLIRAVLTHIAERHRV